MKPRWLARLEEHHHLLGVASDRVVADRTGVSVSIVRAYREQQGIAAPGERLPPPPRRREVREPAPRDPRVEAILREHADRIGREPDWLVARDLGVKVADIEAFREQEGTSRRRDE